MKKLAIAILVAIYAFPSMAQSNADTEKHLLFKGFPIDGKLDDFVLKMRKVGFEFKGKDDGIAFLEGEFASYKQCQIGIVTQKPKDLVSKIVVLFPFRNNWNSLATNYFNLKSMLTEKYPTISECIEKFESNNKHEDDNLKMYDVKFDKCKYYCLFDTGKGEIELSIEHDNLLNCYIKLLYVDATNNQEVLREAMDDL